MSKPSKNAIDAARKHFCRLDNDLTLAYLKKHYPAIYESIMKLAALIDEAVEPMGEALENVLPQDIDEYSTREIQAVLSDWRVE